MQLDQTDQAWLLQALERLAIADDRGFEDSLWLGFGDGWRPMIGLLTRRGYIEVGGPDRSTPRMTRRGTSLLGQMRRSLAAVAG
ncbi:MAG: hypothetical protein AAF235_04170 [Planctomycetota bacterium]